MDGCDDWALPCYCEEDGGAYLVVHEVADSGSHYHAVLHSTAKLEAIRIRFKRMFPNMVGNGMFSISVVKDLAKYQRYLCKGTKDTKPEVVGAYGVNYGSIEWQDEQHAAYWANNDELRRVADKASVIEAVTASCISDAVSWNDRSKIAEIYIRELVRRDKPINVFSVRSSINLIQVKLCPTEDAIKDLANHVCQY